MPPFRASVNLGVMTMKGYSILLHYRSLTIRLFCGGARGVVVIAAGNEHGDTSSNPGRD